MRILVCGSRTISTDSWENASRLAWAITARTWEKKGAYIPTIVEGCAKGADTLAEMVAYHAGFAVDHYPIRTEDWERHGKRAGYLRNTVMLDSGVDHAIIIPDITGSRGTDMMLDLTRQRNIPRTILHGMMVNHHETGA